MEIWVIVCIQKPSHHFLQIFRPLHMFEIVFRDSSFYPKQYLHFVCYGLSAQTSPKRLVWKTGIWRQIMMSQTTHTKYKWHHMPLNETPMKIFCVRPCLMITMAVLHLSPVSLNMHTFAYPSQVSSHQTRRATGGGGIWGIFPRNFQNIA